MSKPRYHLNVLGDFYVVDECCTMCGVPFGGDGPKLFGVEGDEHCYVKKQPETPAEVETMLDAIRAAELQCIRYAGNDNKILAALESAGERDVCDHDGSGVTSSLPEAIVAAMFDSPPTSDAALEIALRKPMPALPGDPWARWLLLALHRHEHRQAWVGEIVRDRLSGSLDDIARAGGFAHPEGRQSGEVPGMPGWHFRFHGVGCCLTREGGEELDVDFVDGGTDWIDPWFFQAYLESVADGPRAELGLPCLKPFEEAWTTDLEPLRDLGWIEGDHRVRITDAGRALATILQPPEDYSGSRLATAWHAGVIGRLDLALEFLESSEVQNALAAAQDELLHARADALERRVGGNYAREALKALAQLGKEPAESCVARQLGRQPVDGVVSAALDLVEEWGAEPHREALLETMERAKGTDAPAPHIRARCAELLITTTTDTKLKKAERKALLKALKKPGRASDGEAGLLLYLLDQRLGIKRLKKALKSSVPFARSQAAGALGLIGSAEALEALRSSENPEAQTILAALRGQPPVNGPEPIGQPIEWEGQERRVYAMSELIDAEVGDMTAALFEGLQEQYGPLLRRWFAS